MPYEEGDVLFSPKRVKCAVLPEASDGGRDREKGPPLCLGRDGGSVAQSSYFLVPATPWVGKSDSRSLLCLERLSRRLPSQLNRCQAHGDHARECVI